MKRASRRFTPSGWARWLGPLLLGILLLGLVATLALILLSVLGVLPGMPAAGMPAG